MKRQSLLNVIAAALVLALSQAATADPDKDESGKGRGGKREYKEEFWDGACKVERK